jgi:hypothetical protein
MLYEPKFCCNCGDKIERVNWGLLASRRFCELCATHYQIYDKIPLIALGIGLLFGVLGLGVYLQKPENSLNISSHQIVGNFSQTNKNQVDQANSARVSTNQNIQELAQEGNSANEFQTKAQTALVKQNLPAITQTKQIENKPVIAQETIYFCGAQTKKGTPCGRRVKGGGRCWQHVGQTAMLPPEKLIVSQ